jgi:flagellar basal body rod protein FlgG
MKQFLFSLFLLVLVSCAANLAKNEKEDIEKEVVNNSSEANYYCSQEKDFNFACEEDRIFITTDGQVDTRILIQGHKGAACSTSEEFFIDQDGLLKDLMRSPVLLTTGETVTIPTDVVQLKVNYLGKILVSYDYLNFIELGQIATARCSCTIDQLGENCTLDTKNTLKFNSFKFCGQRVNLFPSNLTQIKSENILNINIDTLSFFVLKDIDDNIHYSLSNLFFIDEEGYIREIESEMKVLQNVQESTYIKIPSNVDLKTLEISPSGEITGKASGVNQVVGQIILARFINPEGLNIHKTISGLYAISMASGEPLYASPGELGIGEAELFLDFDTTQNISENFEYARMKINTSAWFTLREVSTTNSSLIATGSIIYTKNPNFIIRKDRVIASLTTSSPLLGESRELLKIPRGADISSISVNSEGALVVEVDGATTTIGKPRLVNFNDEELLEVSNIDPTIYSSDEDNVISSSDTISVTDILVRNSNEDCTEKEPIKSNASIESIEILDSNGEVCGKFKPMGTLEEATETSFDGSYNYIEAVINDCSCDNAFNEIDCGFLLLINTENEESFISVENFNTSSGEAIGSFLDASICDNSLSIECQENKYGEIWTSIFRSRKTIDIMVTSPNGNIKNYFLKFIEEQQQLI